MSIRPGAAVVARAWTNAAGAGDRATRGWEQDVPRWVIGLSVVKTASGAGRARLLFCESDGRFGQGPGVGSIPEVSAVTVAQRILRVGRGALLDEDWPNGKS